MFSLFLINSVEFINIVKDKIEKHLPCNSPGKPLIQWQNMRESQIPSFPCHRITTSCSEFSVSLRSLQFTVTRPPWAVKIHEDNEEKTIHANRNSTYFI